MHTTRVAAVVVACAIVASGAAFAQSAPDPRSGASTPVQVMNTTENPVPVTGTVTGQVTLTNSRLDVAVVNDIVYKPYLVSRSAAFVRGDAPQFEFDVPDGMRLIVETMTVRFALDAAANAVMQFGAMTPAGFAANGEITLQQQGTIVDLFGRPQTWITGTHAIKLRIDAAPDDDDELILFPRLPDVNGTANVLVAGYLVPIP